MDYFPQTIFKFKTIELSRDNFKLTNEGSTEFRNAYSGKEYANRIFRLTFLLDDPDVDRLSIKCASVNSDKIYDCFREFSALFGYQYQIIIMLKNANDFPDSIEFKYPIESEESINEQIQMMEMNISKLKEKLERIKK